MNAVYARLKRLLSATVSGALLATVGKKLSIDLVDNKVWVGRDRHSPVSGYMRFSPNARTALRLGRRGLEKRTGVGARPRNC